jgi:hypothetical protein
MSKATPHLLAVTLILLFIVALSPLQASAAAPDATLYTSYFFNSNQYQNVTWIVCGSTQQTSGCYGSGSLGPFGRVGNMLEGNPTVNRTRNSVTRDIYVVDVAGGNGGNGVVLYVYKKTDVVTASSDTITVTLTSTVTLPLNGGTNVHCSMAANKGFVFIGTDQTTQGVEVDKSNLSLTTFGGFSPPINVTSITANAYGYVTATFGAMGSEDAFITFAPNGGGEGDGGGSWFMLDTVNGVASTTIQ